MTDIVNNIIPKTINGVMMWIISFLMLFLLIRKSADIEKKKLKYFLNVENFIISFVFLLTLISFILNVFVFGGSGIERVDHLLIPATIYSIVMSVIALAIFLLTILHYKRNITFVSSKKFIYALGILLLYLAIRKFNYIISVPYGTLFYSLINLVIDICIFGLLLPFILASILMYTFFIIKQK